MWQPQVVRARQESMVEQCTVPVKSRIGALEMDLRVCKTHISVLRKSYVSSMSIHAVVLLLVVLLYCHYCSSLVMLIV